MVKLDINLTEREAMQFLVAGMETHRDLLDAAIADLRVKLTMESPEKPSRAQPREKPPEKTGRGHISEEGRAKIAEAQRKRWAAVKNPDESGPKLPNSAKTGRKRAEKTWTDTTGAVQAAGGSLEPGEHQE